MRPHVVISIPIQRETAQLERTANLIAKHTTNYTIAITKAPDLNVSEARAMAMRDLPGDQNLVCFLDDDSEMIMDGWLDRMVAELERRPDAGAVFGGEWWGTEPETPIAPAVDGCEIEYGPAACMLMDRRRIPAGVEWDTHIGLRSGWLGGDFEEVDYCCQLRAAGLKLYRATDTLFHHTGGRSTLKAWGMSDRARSVAIMNSLILYKYAKWPNDRDFFRGIRYVKARDDDDTMLAPGQTMEGCYRDVIRRYGLQYVSLFKRLGVA